MGGGGERGIGAWQRVQFGPHFLDRVTAWCVTDGLRVGDLQTHFKLKIEILS